MSQFLCWEQTHRVLHGIADGIHLRKDLHTLTHKTPQELTDEEVMS